MPFTKGKSGNPGGRPQGQGVTQLLQRKYGKDGKKLFDEIERLAWHGEDEHVRLKALAMLADRGWGKPKETQEHIFPDPVRVIHTFQQAHA
jgi:hypothetical protein